MEKENLTQYGSQELSLRVMNDEGLYLQRHHIGFVADVVSRIFEFTDEQIAELEKDLADDLKELQ